MVSAISTRELTRRIIPGRRIDGISAILLPFAESGGIDWDGFGAHLERTAKAGLTPAVNMDTGWVNVLSAADRRNVLAMTREALGGARFVAGAFVEGQAGELRTLYRDACAEIEGYGGTPILFQSSALQRMAPAEVVNLYREVAASCERLLLFELGTMFAPFGQIWDLDMVRELMQIPQVVGMKHSSLDRALEWQRLELRDAVRPDFKVYTGNDLAIDMVIYGSDYLLGLSTFAPDAFAARDALWAAGDPGFFALNDVLQYLGTFAFRPPVPAYKHSAAQFLKLRGWLQSDATAPDALRRPSSDLPILQDIVERLHSAGF